MQPVYIKNVRLQSYLLISKAYLLIILVIIYQ